MAEAKIGVIVQARMSSRRFPGKTLHPVLGKPMLGYVIERLSRCTVSDGLVVATSAEDGDTPIAEFCRAAGVRVFRGPLENVAERHVGALNECGFDAFVRITADSPMLDQRLVDKAICMFRGGSWDVVTNTLRRTFPRGQSVEVVNGAAFKKAFTLMSEPDDFEHVTRYFHRNPGDFRMANFEFDRDCSGVQLSVDTPEDMRAFEGMLSRMDRPHWEYTVEELIALAGGERG